MGIEITLDDVRPVGEGLWETPLSPREVRSLGACNSDAGTVSVMLLKAHSFNEAQGAMSFSPDDAVVLNVGSTSRAVIIAAISLSEDSGRRDDATSLSDSRLTLARGDHEFLGALDQVPDEVKRAGEAILMQVRQRFPGSLRAVSARRFQETPDNFWFVAVQPRDQSLSITVRGLPNRFATSRLTVVEDRRPYSRFKVRGLADVREAVSVICSAVRKIA